MIEQILSTSRPLKRLLSVTYDSLAIPMAVLAAMCLRYGTIAPPIDASVSMAIMITSIITIIAFVRLGLYRAVVRFMTMRAFSTLAIGIAVSAATLATCSFLIPATIPRSSILIYFFTAFAFLGLPRLFIRSIVNQLGKVSAQPVIIYGAGNQGVALLRALTNSKEYRPVAFIDDSTQKQRTLISGLRVSSPEKLIEITERFDTRKVLLALGNTTLSERRKLVEKLANLNLEVLTAPSVSEISIGGANIEELREIEIDDLLGRPSVSPDEDLLKQNIYNKTVAITGAGGSIGSELSRQVLSQSPNVLILIELNEFALYSIEQELSKIIKAKSLSTKLISFLGDVKNEARLTIIFRKYNVETVYHAAAYKHVPIVEHNVIEGINNNVFGTLSCANAAISADVERFVLISTDKAVRPTNVMGASKRLSELVLQALTRKQTSTLFCMVRFGNVLGSSGSVVPLFRKQIKSGGPVTVTHPDIIRYFMTIPEASQLVIQAGAMGKGGDVFVLDMGEPVKITMLAQKMIRLAGLSEKSAENPDGEIEISFTGLRPGEKLYEELLIGEDVAGTSHQRIMTANEVYLEWEEMSELLSDLDEACNSYDVLRAIGILLSAPTAYKPSRECSDWLVNTELQTKE